MAKHSKNYDEGWSRFLELCFKAKSLNKLEELFGLFLTLEEQRTLGRRYLVIKALEKNELTQREIAAHFNLSISQITRGSNALKIIPKDLKNFLKQELES